MKHVGINLLEMYSLGNHKQWNAMLNDCYAKLDINRLARVLYEIQVGMDDLVKKNLRSPEIDVWYCRLHRSIEITAKKIIRAKEPLPVDDPLNQNRSLEIIAAKRKRDALLKEFMVRSSF